jgi:hypothetical protein
MKNKRKLFVAINPITMMCFASFYKEELAGLIKVNRNSVVIKNGYGMTKGYLLFEIMLRVKNENMIRNTDNLKQKK